MAGHRSSLPLRLQQILSGGRAMWPELKLEHDANDVRDVLDLTLSMDTDEEKLILHERAEVDDFELIPCGRNITVGGENKHEYVTHVAENWRTTAIRPQINAFMESFRINVHGKLLLFFCLTDSLRSTSNQWMIYEQTPSVLATTMHPPSSNGSGKLFRVSARRIVEFDSCNLSLAPPRYLSLSEASSFP
ncbi:uncharacterized protein LOC108953621 isoform X1 [Musa acuminata AAA Group]